MKNLFLSLLVLTVLSIFFSCKKSVNSNDVYADVFVKSSTYNGSPGFSTIYSVIANGGGVSAVTVSAPNGSSFPLADRDGTGTAFFKDTSMAGSAYSHEPTAPGIYNFHVTFANGEEKLFTNTQKSDYLLPPVIDSLYVKPGGTTVRLKWEPIVGAQAYLIRISSGQNEIMPWLQFENPAGMYTERLIYTFNSYLPGTITFELRAVIYESSDQKYVQAVSYSSRSIDL